MNKEMDNFIQKSIIGEDINLSNMLADIVPIKEQKFTDLELEANKKETFSVVVYKKENPIVRFFKSIKLSFEKLRIMSKTREVSYVKNENR
jgi:hypothetical protein